MSQPAATGPVLKPHHYQALCGLALTAIVLLQMQQTGFAAAFGLFTNVLLGIIGVLAFYFRVPLSPMLVLLAMAVPHVVELLAFRFNPDLHAARFLDLSDVLMCLAALAYVIGHYRLHGLWHGVLPADKRISDDGEPPTPPRVRSEGSLHPMELTVLVFVVPAFVLLAEFALLILRQRWGVVDLPPRWKQFVLFAWVLLIGMFVAAHAFRHWRRLQMDRASAMLILQDELWNETRGEQRRINRWLAWKKLQKRGGS